jgi:hypothetical protein
LQKKREIEVKKYEYFKEAIKNITLVFLDYKKDLYNNIKI